VAEEKSKWLTWEDVQGNNACKVHDNGFVVLVDHMGSDADIAEAARISYGQGTKTINDDRNLIRYLMRHQHTTPFEMCEVKFMIKMPIFIMRQLVRHRTASINEYSGRYSEMSDEFYVPDTEYLAPQSQTNRQGRDGDMDIGTKVRVLARIEHVNKISYDAYQDQLEDDLSRELARITLPLNNYTIIYWKANLKNFLHMIRLRADGHAQQEIQDFANAMYELAKPLFPLACEAWEDYQQDGMYLSRQERDLLNRIIDKNRWFDYTSDMRTDKGIREQHGISQRELDEFRTKFRLGTP
jgi:thymidylate synthase (FAD)